jgi:hypothetical protein
MSWAHAVGSDMKAFLPAVLLGWLSAIGCRSSTAPIADTLNGSFALTLVNGRSLPDTQAVAPSTKPGGTSCAIVATSGTLILDAAAGRFTLPVNGYNSCRAGEFVLLTEYGTYSQRDTSLSLEEPYPDEVVHLTGHFDQANIRIHGVFYDYVFKRQ